MISAAFIKINIGYFIEFGKSTIIIFQLSLEFVENGIPDLGRMGGCVYFLELADTRTPCVSFSQEPCLSPDNRDEGSGSKGERIGHNVRSEEATHYRALSFQYGFRVLAHDLQEPQGSYRWLAPTLFPTHCGYGRYIQQTGKNRLAHV